MDTTLFLAQIWGPVILAIGLGIFVSRSHYVNVYRHLENETLAALVFGMLAMSAGIVHIQYHNVWATVPQIIVSLLGWGLLIKGAVFVVAPRIVERAGDWAAANKLIPIGGGVTLVLGAYLSWLGYFVS